MIEKRISNELNLKRYRRFKRNRAAVFGVWVLLLLTFFSTTAEFWANNQPIYLRYHGVSYFPIVRTYHPSVFGRSDISVMDYHALQMDPGDQAVWPLVHWDPFEHNNHIEGGFPSPPTVENIMGTDDSGRDVFTRLLYGYRYSMGYAILTWLSCSVFGLILGALMGFLGGWTDLLGQRAIEVLESMPQLLLLITLISIFPASLTLLIAFTTLFGWMSISIYFRAEFLKLRKREFIEAARALGSSRKRLIFTHILPNSLTPWITMTPFLISGGISGLAALDFLGFGLPAPTPSWGELLEQAYKNFSIAWWLAVYPSAALFLTLVVTNLIGEGVRDALDPRT
jgi:microcin C transport system permease protein